MTKKKSVFLFILESELTLSYVLNLLKILEYNKTFSFAFLCGVHLFT